MTNTFDITAYGATGDGKTDCTKAIQRALDEAGAVSGAVIVPPGRYLCGRLRIPEKISLSGWYAADYSSGGGSVLVLGDENAPCLLDVTESYGSTIEKLSLEGERMGRDVHGIMMRHPTYVPDSFDGGGREDTTKIEKCHVAHFTGDGIHLKHAFCFTVRHCHLYDNDGNGLYLDGWDGFLLDNWMSGNGKAGIYGDKAFSSLTITGNRVEWNRLAGLYASGAAYVNITGNNFDRSYGPAIWFDRGGEFRVNVTITGNIFNRSGKPRETPFANPYESAHILMERCINMAVTGNTFNVGKDDGNKGRISPDYGIVCRQLKSCVIMGNTMQNASCKQNIVDLGEHEEGVLIKDNVGSELTDDDKLYPMFRDQKQ